MRIFPLLSSRNSRDDKPKFAAASGGTDSNDRPVRLPAGHFFEPGGAPVSGAANRVSRLGTGDLVYLVVLAGVLGHLDADLLPLTGFGDRLALDLHGFDALAEVARVS